MLSVTSKYALRALTHLGALPEKESMLGKDLAKRAAIPANYLSKILWMLGSAGLISAMRGSGGGYRLRRKPEEIFLFEVVDLFDRTRIAPTCFLGEDRACSDDDACSAHALWREVCDRTEPSACMRDRTSPSATAPAGFQSFPREFFATSKSSRARAASFDFQAM